MGMGATIQRAVTTGAGLTEVALVLVAAGSVAVGLIGVIAFVVALFCKREAPSRRLRQIIETLRSPRGR
jgi:hypothetical protein